MIPLNIHFKVSKHPTCHMARLHPVAVQMFSKDLLVPLSGHMPFCLALYQNRAKVIPRPKELMGSAARDTHSQTGAPWKQWGNTSCTRAWKCLAYRKENLYEALKKKIMRKLIRCCGGIFHCKKPQKEYKGLEWRKEKMNNKGLGPWLVRGESVIY